jgi:hypothetical protein
VCVCVCVFVFVSHSVIRCEVSLNSYSGVPDSSWTYKERKRGRNKASLVFVPENHKFSKICYRFLKPFFTQFGQQMTKLETDIRLPSKSEV